MKSEKGVTLGALVIYITVFTIIISMLTFVSNYFYRNIAKIKDAPKYINEFNKFSMFFVADVKRNSDVKAITNSTLELKDGTTYKYENNCIYRNNMKIAQYVKSFSFTQSIHTQNAFSKIIVNVNTTIGDNKEEISRNIDFVLKYW